MNKFILIILITTSLSIRGFDLEDRNEREREVAMLMLEITPSKMAELLDIKQAQIMSVDYQDTATSKVYLGHLADGETVTASYSYEGDEPGQYTCSRTKRCYCAKSLSDCSRPLYRIPLPSKAAKKHFDMLRAEYEAKKS